MEDISKIDSDRLFGNVEIGDVCYSFRSVKDGWLLCNGDAVSREEYANLFEIIGTTFGEGDGSTTFNLPNCKGKFLQMVNDEQTIGTELEAGLPNITGKTSIMTGLNSGGGELRHAGSGSIRLTKTEVLISNGGSTTGWWAYADFTEDASRSSQIYGKSSTVQPPAILVNYFIKY